MFSPKQLSEIEYKIKNCKNILIVTHYNPDGDAIGSSLALYHFLKSLGVEATVVVPNDFPKFLKWMPDAKQIVIADYKRKLARDLFYHADLIFCLDFNTFSRIGIMGDWLKVSYACKVLIDHHQQPEDFDYVYSNTEIPATCQMVYHLIEAMQKESNLTKEISECLYTGIMTDTGGFRFRSTSAETHRVAGLLIANGADPSEISNNVLDNSSLNRIKLLALILSRMELIEEGKVAILYVKREELKEYGFEKGDTESVVNYGLNLLGSQVSAFFAEDLYEDLIKISFRSKKTVDVNQFSRSFFEGGGHINAAGGKSLTSLTETIENFKLKAKELNFV